MFYHAHLSQKRYVKTTFGTCSDYANFQIIVLEEGMGLCRKIAPAFIGHRIVYPGSGLSRLKIY